MIVDPASKAVARQTCDDPWRRGRVEEPSDRQPITLGSVTEDLDGIVKIRRRRWEAGRPRSRSIRA